MLFLDTAVFGKFTKIIPEQLQNIENWIFHSLLHMYVLSDEPVLNTVA